MKKNQKKDLITALFKLDIAMDQIINTLIWEEDNYKKAKELEKIQIEIWEEIDKWLKTIDIYNT